MSQQINLFNPLFLKQRKIFSAMTMVQALGVVLLACILVAVAVGWQVRIREKQAADSAQRLKKVQAALDSATSHYAPRAPDPPLVAQLDKAQADVQSLEQVEAALNGGGFGDTKGYSVYFRSFARQIVDGLWLTGIDIDGAGRQIDLRGRALHAELVPEYLQRLGREPEMKSKTFATLDMDAPKADAKSDSKAEKPDTDAKLKTAVPYIEFDLKSLENEKQDSGGKAK